MHSLLALHAVEWRELCAAQCIPFTLLCLADLLATLVVCRVLLNKCQEEFEAGDSAMKAVDAREKAAAEKKASGEVRSTYICSTLNESCSCLTLKSSHSGSNSTSFILYFCAREQAASQQQAMLLVDSIWVDVTAGQRSNLGFLTVLYFLGDGIRFSGLQTEEEEEDDDAAAEGDAEKSEDDAKSAAKPEGDDKEEGEVGPAHYLSCRSVPCRALLHPVGRHT